MGKMSEPSVAMAAVRSTAEDISSEISEVSKGGEFDAA